MDLEALRARLDEIDAQFIALAAARQRLEAEIGSHQLRAGLPIRDFARERVVLELAASHAREAGLDPALGQALLRQLIESASAAREQERVRNGAGGSGQTALVIGGGGRMGQWFARFLDSQGYAVTVADPAGSGDAFRCVADWRNTDLDFDLIVVAAPLRASAVVLHELAEQRPRGIVFDVGSLKSPLAAGFEALKAAGVRTTSIHPMFGPSANVLSGRHVIFVDLGDGQATALARALFAETMAISVDMTLAEHDRLMGFVLGLSHALNIAFFTALADSREMAQRFARASSTTFDRQLEIARGVASENPHLYYEIQHLNAHGGEALAAFERALHKVLGTIRNGDESAFVQIMSAGRRYLERRDAGGV